MGKRIVVTGRGGTGKTTLAAIAARFLPSPKLLVDADPDLSLGAMLGVDLRSREVRTISEALYDIQSRKTSVELDSMTLPEKIEYLLQLSCLYESEDFDLITLGVKWTRGCYCAPNDVLRSIIPDISRNYAFTILDSPAGVEHINRQLLPQVDDIFAVADPSAKSLRNTETLRDIASAIGFRYENLYVVANYRFMDGEEEPLRKLQGAKFLGRIQRDASVERYDWESRSLLTLPEDSPACVSVRELLSRAGYPVRSGSLN
jgi:CO dehydrogenase maturation factor